MSFKRKIVCPYLHSNEVSECLCSGSDTDTAREDCEHALAPSQEKKIKMSASESVQDGGEYQKKIFLNYQLLTIRM